MFAGGGHLGFGIRLTSLMFLGVLRGREMKNHDFPQNFINFGSNPERSSGVFGGAGFTKIVKKFKNSIDFPEMLIFLTVLDSFGGDNFRDGLQLYDLK